MTIGPRDGDGFGILQISYQSILLQFWALRRSQYSYKASMPSTYRDTRQSESIRTEALVRRSPSGTRTGYPFESRAKTQRMHPVDKDQIHQAFPRLPRHLSILLLPSCHSIASIRRHLLIQLSLLLAIWSSTEPSSQSPRATNRYRFQQNHYPCRVLSFLAPLASILYACIYRQFSLALAYYSPYDVSHPDLNLIAFW